MSERKSTDAVLADLKSALAVHPKGTIHRDGSCDWVLTTGSWSFVWNSIYNARECIVSLVREQESLMDLLEERDDDGGR